MKKDNDQMEEDSILINHSQSYGENMFLLRKKWMDQIFSFEDLDKSAYQKNIYREDFSDLIGSIGKSTDLFRLYMAGAITNLTEEAKRQGIVEEVASHLMRRAYLRLSDAKSIEEMTECSTWVEEELHENYKKFWIKDYSYLVRRAVEVIHRNKRKKISTAYVAGYLNVNESYLSNIFHKETGKTVSEYILSVKMDQAEILLKRNVYNLTEISEALGYENYAYFSRQFKKYFGCSPENYMKQKK